MTNGHVHLSLEVLYEQFEYMVFALAMNVLRDRDLAADAAQETWMRFTRYLDAGKHPERPGALLSTIVKRESYRLLPRSAHLTLSREPIEDAKSDPAEVHEAVGRLSAEEAEVITLRYFDGLSIRQLQKHFDLSARAVNYRLKNALERLRKELREA